MVQIHPLNGVKKLFYANLQTLFLSIYYELLWVYKLLQVYEPLQYMYTKRYSECLQFFVFQFWDHVLIYWEWLFFHFPKSPLNTVRTNIEPPKGLKDKSKISMAGWLEEVSPYVGSTFTTKDVVFQSRFISLRAPPRAPFFFSKPQKTGEPERSSEIPDGETKQSN